MTNYISKKLKDGKLEPCSDLSDFLKISIKTFIAQAAIVEEYEVDHIPSEYIVNLIDTFSKYPEYSLITSELMESLLKGQR
jgi:hypothetical protein